MGKPRWPQIRVENEVKVKIKLKTVFTEHQFEIKKISIMCVTGPLLALTVRGSRNQQNKSRMQSVRTIPYILPYRISCLPS
jgi:hypothetical protein